MTVRFLIQHGEAKTAEHASLDDELCRPVPQHGPLAPAETTQEQRVAVLRSTTPKVTTYVINKNL